ncbi:hypothetical protein Bbelb_200180 [Branchiostoma belcheri]|nr:hypothetical protein Bbelb_200180 [Branchiostoma belcheri]
MAASQKDVYSLDYVALNESVDKMRLRARLLGERGIQLPKAITGQATPCGLVILREVAVNTIMSVTIIKRHRHAIVGGVAIHEPNRDEQMLTDSETIEDIREHTRPYIYFDSHSKVCFRKRCEMIKLKSRPEHSTKVYAWVEISKKDLKPRPEHSNKVYALAGISKRGRTPIVVFKGVMDADFFCLQILLERNASPIPPAEGENLNWMRQTRRERHDAILVRHDNKVVSD